MNTQIEAKTVAQSYGKYIIAVIALALVGYGSWQYKLHREALFSEEASVQYDTLLTALKNKDTKTIEEKYVLMQEKYASTPYASLAALIQARMDIEHNAMDKAITHLQAAVEVAKTQKGPVQHIARVRLARLLADQQKYEEAMNVLTPPIDTRGYTTLYEEAKGDVYLLKNELDKAREAYKVALQAIPTGVNADALQLKMNDLKNREE